MPSERSILELKDLDADIPRPNNLPEPLLREIEATTSVERCLTLARLFLRRAKELTRQNSSLPRP